MIVKKTQRFTSLWLLFWTCWTVTTILLWHCSPAITTNYAGTSLYALAGQVLHGIMLWGIDVLVILLASANRNNSSKLRDHLSNVVMWWFYALLTGVIVTIFVLFSGKFKVTQLYTSLFPVLRNEVPILTGIGIAYLFLPFIKNKSKNDKKVILLILWTFLWLPFIFGTNMFHLNSLRNPLIFTILFIIAGISELTDATINLFKKCCVYGFFGFLLIAMMPYVSEVTLNSSNPSRFTTVANPLLILSALYFVKFVGNNLSVSKWNINAVIVSLTIVYTPAFIGRWSTFVIKRVGHSTIKLAILSVISSVIICTFVWCTLPLITKLTNKSSLKVHVVGYFRELNDVEQLPSWLAMKCTDLRTFVSQHHVVMVAALTSYVLSFVSFLLTHMSFNYLPYIWDKTKYNIFMFTFFQRQTLVILNALLIFAFIMFLWAIVRRFYFALFLSVTLTLLWGVATHIKIVDRNEPIMPSEVKMVSAWGNLIGMVGTGTIVMAAFAFCVLIGLAIFFERKDKTKALSLRSTVIALVVLPLLVISSFGWNHSGAPLNTLMRGLGDDPMFFDQLNGVRCNGPIVQFLNNMDVKVMDKPSGYSKAEMFKIRKRYANYAKSINLTRKNTLKNQTIIFNLSESFADPRRVPGVVLRKNPIPNIDRLKRDNTSGLMFSSGYGGGTANMEYMVLTGFALSNFSETLATPYTQLVDNLANNPTIVGSFKHSVAIHPYLANFYNRESVYDKFGFNAFYHLKGKYHIKYRHKIGKSMYLSDQTAYENTMSLINKYHKGQFIQLVTMQNHMPYNNDWYSGHSKFRAKGVSGTNIDSLEEYAVGINYTDKAVASFIKKINKVQRPITVVFYGDHLPGSIYGNSMMKYGLKLHETDYFIYSNKYARQHGAVQKLEKDTRYVDPNDFIALVAEQTNSKVNWYQAMLTQILHNLPAFALNTQQKNKVKVDSRSQFINQNGKFVSQKHWTKKQKQLWHDYKLVQYDVTAGKQYLIRDGQLK